MRIGKINALPSESAGPVLDFGGMGAFLGHIFLKKRTLCLLAPHKQMPFSTILKYFFEIQGTRPGVIVAPKKRLE